MSPMARCATLLVLVAALAVPNLGSESAARPPVQVAQAAKDVNLLNLEVLALQAIEQLHATPGQLQTLAKLAPETMSKSKARKPAKASDKFAKKLGELREALLKRDADDIQIITGEIGELQAAEKTFVDNTIDMTPAARKRAPELLKQLAPRQVALYLASFESLLVDPVEGVYAAMEEGIKQTPAEWKETRDGIAQEVAELVAGLDPAQSQKVADKVGAILDKGHKMNEPDLKKNKAELEKSVHQIVDAAGPVEILRHFMERHLALMLSNPQLAAAVDARQKRK
ncbi:MAG: hypothetical protein K2R98_20880 [Gemmataceae bacterium]|nr:hypothetical protein [Gemmataceae bacterium]